MVSEIEQVLGVRVCLNTITNCLDGELFSLKSVPPIIENVNRSENKIKPATYLEIKNCFHAEPLSGHLSGWMTRTAMSIEAEEKNVPDTVAGLLLYSRQAKVQTCTA